MPGKTSKWIDLACNGVLRELTLANQAALLQSLRHANSSSEQEQRTEEPLNHALDSAPKRVKKSKPRPRSQSSREDTESRYESQVSLEMPNESRPSTLGMPKTISKKKRKKHIMPRPMEEDSDPGIREFQTFMEVGLPPESSPRPRPSPKKRKSRPKEENPRAEPMEPRTLESLIDLDLVTRHESNPRHSSKKKKKREKRPGTDPAEEDAEPTHRRPSVEEMFLDLGLTSKSNPSALKKKKSFKRKTSAQSTMEDVETTSQSLVDLPSESSPNSKPAHQKQETSDKKPKANVAKSRAKATKPRPATTKRPRQPKTPRATYSFQRHKVPGLVSRAEELIKKWKEPIPPKDSKEILNKKLRAWCTSQTEKNFITDFSYKKPTNYFYVLTELRKSLIRHDWPGVKKVLQLLLRCADISKDRLIWKIMMTLFMYYPGAEPTFRSFVEQNRGAYSSVDIWHGLLIINGLAPFTRYQKTFVSAKTTERKSKELDSQGSEVIPDKV